MASLNDSLRVKANTKAPAVVGADPLVKSDVTAPEGQSGGIAKSKQVKNAGSTSNVVPKVAPDSRFILGLGGTTQSDKSGGYH